jgi:aryl-alcohol dehydrogenase-like predicted oxidoreductase
MTMSLDEYVTLGRSGLRVSPFCLGAMTFGKEFGIGCDAATAELILDHYVGRGGNFVDTANLYNAGRSEEIIGGHLARDAARRQRLVIATKFGGSLSSGDPNAGGASRKAVVNACEQSLRRLGTDYIDLYWQHWSDRFTPVDETMRALDDLVRAGKVRYIGFSDTPAWRIAQAQVTALTRGWTPIIALQIEYSLLERTVEGELMPMALEFGLGVTPWSPLRSGFLSGKYTRSSTDADSPGRSASVKRNMNDTAFRVVDALVATAAEANTTPARCALAWLRSRPGVASPILGARTLAQLDDNLGALEVTLTPAQLTILDDVSRPKLNFPVDFLRTAETSSYAGTSINGERFAAWNPTARSTTSD